MIDVDLTSKSVEVIRLYEQGYSSKDICSACNLSVSSIRKILQNAGFDTRGYRRASDEVKDKVLLLIKAGYPYNQIEQLLHVSTHLVREIVLHNNLTGFAPRFHHPMQLDVCEAEVSSDVLAALKKLYLAGEYGLVECLALSGASDKEFLWFVYHLTDADKQRHRDKAREKIEKLHEDGVPVMAIAKSMHISPSIVKRILRKR